MRIKWKGCWDVVVGFVRVDVCVEGIFSNLQFSWSEFC